MLRIYKILYLLVCLETYKKGIVYRIPINNKITKEVL
jgi:hypothetical protein